MGRGASRTAFTFHLSLLTSHFSLLSNSQYHPFRYGFLTFTAQWKHCTLFIPCWVKAAATLVGLLFVSVTFNRQILESAPGTGQRRNAENIFRQFVFLVWLSLAMLLPMTALELSLNLLLQSRGIAPSSSFSLLITVSFLRTVLGAIRRMAAAAFGLII
jgi:hypothetical protein